MGLFKKSKQEKPASPVSQNVTNHEESCSCNQVEEDCSCNQAEEGCSCNQAEELTQPGSCGCAGGCEDSKENSVPGVGNSGMTIKILGSGCKNCILLSENVHTAMEEMGLQAEVVKVTDFAEITGYGVMSTPAIVINEQVVSYGKVLKPADVKKLLERYV